MNNEKQYIENTLLELVATLDVLCDENIANRSDPKSRFISCRTPNGIPWYWVRAEQAIEAGRWCLKNIREQNLVSEE